MNAFVNIHEAKTHLSRLVDRAHGGEEIILAKGGKPWARLVPLEEQPKKPRVPGRLKGQLGRIPDNIWFDPMPEEELRSWEGTDDDFLK